MIASGRSVPDITRSLAIGENIIRRWRRAATEATQTPVPLQSATLPLQVSLAVRLPLHKRLRALKVERDILKKALGIFSQPW